MLFLTQDATEQNCWHAVTSTGQRRCQSAEDGFENILPPWRIAVLCADQCKVPATKKKLQSIQDLLHHFNDMQHIIVL